MTDETPKHANEMTDAEWRETTNKIRQGIPLSPAKPKPTLERHASEFTREEWRRELNRINMKGL
ncbi:hypothetical protein [Rhodoblastus sp.]|uniref:hypothetical protein n=1 Tax=Rhodoblastus sp. TaxID=1962975 RepID=UPI003F9C24EE